jgi:hypothetical protein
MSFTIRDTTTDDVRTKINFGIKSTGKTLIDRGNPTMDDTLLLDDFNSVHYYHYTGTPVVGFPIPTLMVENAVYEVHFKCTGGTESNNDMRLYPGLNDPVASRYYTFYKTTSTNYHRTVVFQQSNEMTGFHFDFYPGELGYDPVGKITIYNDRACKKIQLESGDTSSSVYGKGYWLNDTLESEEYTYTSQTTPQYNTSTIWTTVGTLAFGIPSYATWRIRVSRVA